MCLRQHFGNRGLAHIFNKPLRLASTNTSARAASPSSSSTTTAQEPSSTSPASMPTTTWHHHQARRATSAPLTPRSTTPSSGAHQQLGSRHLLPLYDYIDYTKSDGGFGHEHWPKGARGHSGRTSHSGASSLLPSARERRLEAS